MNTTKLIAAINAGLAAEDAWDKALSDALKAVGDASRDEVRVVILPVIAAKCKCVTKDGAGKAKGTQVLDSEHANYEAAKSVLRRWLEAMFGKVESTGSSEPVKFTREQKAAAKAFLKLFESKAQAVKALSA
jgi:hypothetical protein